MAVSFGGVPPRTSPAATAVPDPVELVAGLPGWDHHAVDFASMMQLEPHGADVYVGVGPTYPWGGLYGGQIVAQGLRAAAATVEERFSVHSLHSYFIRRGLHDEPIRFEVDRTRNGRSFVTRTVTARQSVGVILTMSLSFQVDEAGHDVQIAALPSIPPPEELTGDSWSPMFERRFAGQRNAEPGKAILWMRLVDDIGDDPVLRACALAYLSDDVPTDAVVAIHPERPAPGMGDAFEYGFMSASLDHSIWFHRPPSPSEWHVHDFTSHAYLSSRGLAVGHVLTREGVHVATIAQEVLLRKS
jgi:acyl-CoA thioesterase II